MRLGIAITSREGNADGDVITRFARGAEAAGLDSVWFFDSIGRGRQSLALVSAAGPASNLVLALVFAGLFRLGLVDVGDVSRQALQSVDVGAWATLIATFAVRLNLILAAFNLLPIPPLDGGGILAGVVPGGALPAVRKLQRVGPPLLIAMVLLTMLTDFDVLGVIFEPVYALGDRLMGGG